jgi:ABC-type transport system involved in multi-copper enzyme maturation permease subunit
MAMRWGPGPVFAFESRMAARRWQVYAGRAVLVAGLLASLALVWLTQDAGRGVHSVHEIAQIGESFYTAIMGVELVLVLMVAPAATAGAIGHDRARGGLTHLLVTDLSDAEIVLGKLAARLATTLGIVACALPVLVIASLLGGVDPDAILVGSTVIVGVAVLGVSVALAFSVWASKPYEALMATYAVWAVWLLAPVACPSGRSADALMWTNPFFLIFDGQNNGAVPCALFLAACLAISAILAAVATLRTRAVTVRRAGRSSARRGRRSIWNRPLLAEWSVIRLDRHPILWREWHRRRSSGWGRAIWRLYAALTTAFTALSIVDLNTAPGTNGFQVAIGLLLVSVSAATSLAEERAQGNLDVVLATPLSSREIVLGKWLGAFRPVPWLAVLPAILTVAAGAARVPQPEAILYAVFMVGLILAYGAAVVSMGLLVACWLSRPGRAIALSVATYMAAALVWPIVAEMVGEFNWPSFYAILGVSPFFGAFLPPLILTQRTPFTDHGWIPWGLVLMVGMAVLAATLLALTLATFERSLGRVPERGLGRRDPRGMRDHSRL